MLHSRIASFNPHASIACFGLPSPVLITISNPITSLRSIVASFTCQMHPMHNACAAIAPGFGTAALSPAPFATPPRRKSGTTFKSSTFVEVMRLERHHMWECVREKGRRAHADGAEDHCSQPSTLRSDGSTLADVLSTCQQIESAT